MQSWDRWPRSGQSVASIWNLETWEKDPKTSRDTWDILRQSKAWESHLKHCSGGWSWLCILLSSVTWLQLVLQVLFASLCLNWECLYTQPINSFTTEASQNLYLLLMSEPLLLHFLLQWKNPLQYGSSHLMYLWAPDPRPSPGASSELVPGISVDQISLGVKRKKKKSWYLDLRDLRENFPAPGTVSVTRDAIVSIDLDSLAWNKEHESLIFSPR